MAFGRGVQSVDCVGGHVQRGVEPKRHFGGRKIIVDCLWHAYYFHAHLGEFVRDGQRAIAADYYEAINPEALESLDATLRIIVNHLAAVLVHRILEGIPAIRRPKNRATARKNSANRFEGEILRLFGPDQPVESIGPPATPPSVFQPRSAPHGSNDGVQAGTVASAGAHANRSF